MAELLQTERTYVKDLETCIKVQLSIFFEIIHTFSALMLSIIVNFGVIAGCWYFYC